MTRFAKIVNAVKALLKQLSINLKRSILVVWQCPDYTSVYVIPRRGCFLEYYVWRNTYLFDTLNKFFSCGSKSTDKHGHDTNLHFPNYLNL